MGDKVQRIVSLIASGSAVAAFTVLLGRLWTSSYFDYFGLPVSDLSLDVQDYAFRTKEILLMLILASMVLAGIVWGSDAIGIDRRWTPYTVLWAVLFALVVGFFIAFVVLVKTQSGWLEDSWRVFTIGIGLALGIAAGVPIACARKFACPWGWISAAAIITLLVLLVPFAIVGLARASAAEDVRTQNLSHVVLQFAQQAPAPIRRLDDPTRSNRVYLVLSTPDRLAVAFPYPCTQLGTARGVKQQVGTSPSAHTNLCDVLAFDRQLVTNIEIVGKGGRPSNDDAAKADPVTLDTDPIEADSSRIVFEQPFDFAEALTSSPCPQSGLQDIHGVWFRLDARQAGRVAIGSTGEPTGAQPNADLAFALVSADDKRVCTGLQPPGQQVRVNADTAIMLFVGMKNVGHEYTRRTITLQFSPLSVDTTDCREVPVSSPTATTGSSSPSPALPTSKMSCEEDTTGGIGMRLRVPSGARLTVSVDVDNAGFAPTPANQCPADLTPPKVFVAGVPLKVTPRCQSSPREDGVTTVVFDGFTQGASDGAVEVAACPPAIAKARIVGLRGTLAVPAVAQEPPGQEQAPAAAPAPSGASPVATSC
jgi:hypothetical protein